MTAGTILCRNSAMLRSVRNIKHSDAKVTASVN